MCVQSLICSGWARGFVFDENSYITVIPATADHELHQIIIIVFFGKVGTRINK